MHTAPVDVGNLMIIVAMSLFKLQHFVFSFFLNYFEFRIVDICTAQMYRWNLLQYVFFFLEGAKFSNYIYK